MPAALFSLWDKTGLIETARVLRSLDSEWDFYGSKRTSAQLHDLGLSATDVADVVGEPFPDDLVVTLSKLHFSLLCDRNRRDHMEALAKAGLPYIDFAWVSAYDLQGAIERGENEHGVRKATDMGGIALLRSAAKGRRLVSPSLRITNIILRWMQLGRPDEPGFRLWLAWQAEAYCQWYCGLSADYLRSQIALNGGIPDCCPPLEGPGSEMYGSEKSGLWGSPF